jgi:hypothetical protein
MHGANEKNTQRNAMLVTSGQSFLPYKDFAEIDIYPI